jgi:hypothetical protein
VSESPYLADYVCLYPETWRLCDMFQWKHVNAFQGRRSATRVTADDIRTEKHAAFRFGTIPQAATICDNTSALSSLLGTGISRHFLYSSFLVTLCETSWHTTMKFCLW